MLIIPFFSQFAACYAAALLVGTLALTRGGPGGGTIALTYGLLGLPFGLLAAGLSRLFERVIGWPAAIVATAILLGAMYLLAPNKANFWAGIGLIVPFAVVFAAAWSFLSWRHA